MKLGLDQYLVLDVQQIQSNFIVPQYLYYDVTAQHCSPSHVDLTC